MRGIVPTNIQIISSSVFHKQEKEQKMSIQMFVGCSGDGYEVVFWTETEQSNGQEHRQLNAEKISTQTQEIVQAFNSYLNQLAEQGYFTDQHAKSQTEITIQEINDFRPKQNKQ